ncbi:hypothetical protein Tco_0941112 [Tanacetum coccineum]|uniref:Uncharacterized protein n=1 Tax=Tanacetum coccineum TaxID=301880 RepID=A0ABQ5DQ42_9ASTR
MSDSEHSAVTYTSASEDDLFMGSPGVEVPVFEGPASPDYVPGPEEPEQASTFTISYLCSWKLFTRSSLPVDERQRDEHLAPAVHQLLLIQLKGSQSIAYRVAARDVYYRITGRSLPFL